MVSLSDKEPYGSKHRFWLEYAINNCSIYGALMCHLFPFCDWCEQPLKIQIHLSLHKPSPLKFNLPEKSDFLENNLQTKPNSFK